MRRWYWPLLFAVGSALIISYFFLSSYNSTYQVSSTLIPLNAQTNHYTVSALIKNDEVLDAVSKSVEFDATISELNDAIKIETDMNSVAVKVTIYWDNEEEAVQILKALKANLSFAVTHSAEAGGIKWMDAASSDNGQLSSSDIQTYQIFIIGALVGLFVGMCFSFLLGSLDRRVFDIEAARYGGQVDVVGVVGRIKELRKRHSRKEGKVIVTKSPNQQFVATALHLNRLLESQDRKLLMCIAPTIGCGSSTVVHNIAKVLSGIKSNICIVTPTTDTAAASADQKLHMLYPGVFELSLPLDDLESYESISGRISQIPAVAAKGFELIMVDFPALLENLQISLSAQSMDAALLVCRFGKTQYDEVRSAVSLLARSGAAPIYCVWNFADKSYSDFYPTEATFEVKPTASDATATKAIAKSSKTKQTTTKAIAKSSTTKPTVASKSVSGPAISKTAAKKPTAKPKKAAKPTKSKTTAGKSVSKPVIPKTVFKKIELKKPIAKQTKPKKSTSSSSKVSSKTNKTEEK